MANETTSSHIACFLKSEYANEIKHHVDENGIYWFCANDVANIMEMSSIRSHVQLVPDTKKQYRTLPTTRGEKPSTFVSLDIVLQWIIKSRKPKAIHLASMFGLNVVSRHYMCIESDTVQCICKTFDGEEMVNQFSIGKYFIDLFFPEYNVAVECDEQAHRYKRHEDKKREREIRHINPNVVFIRYNPHEQGFDIFDVINQIYVYISLRKQCLALNNETNNDLKGIMSDMLMEHKYMTRKEFESNLAKYNGKTVAYIVDVDITLPEHEKAIFIDTSTHFNEDMIEYKRDYPHSNVFYTEEFDINICEKVTKMIEKTFDGFYVSCGMYDINMELAKDMVSAIIKKITKDEVQLMEGCLLHRLAEQ